MRLIFCFRGGGNAVWVFGPGCRGRLVRRRSRQDDKTDDDKPADPDTGESTVQEKTFGLLPNPLQKYGIKFAATYIGETLGNALGGIKRIAVYEGRLNLAVDVDLQKLVGAEQLTFHANVFQIHGGGLSRGALQNLFVVSGIEALPAIRLYEAKFEKQWGQNWFRSSWANSPPTANSSSKYTDVFTNASMGWPAITSVDLPSGGHGSPRARQRDGAALSFGRSSSTVTRRGT
jgi:porin